MSLFLFRGGEEAGCAFREAFQGDFSGDSGGFWRGFPTLFYGKKWEEGGERGWKGGRGCGEGEEKLKSAIRKNKFCDHIVFFENHVWGIFLCPELL